MSGEHLFKEDRETKRLHEQMREEALKRLLRQRTWTCELCEDDSDTLEEVARGGAVRALCPACAQRARGGGNGLHSEPSSRLARDMTEEVLVEIVKNMGCIIDRLRRMK